MQKRDQDRKILGKSTNNFTVSPGRPPDNVKVLSRDGRVLGDFFLNKRMHCPKCNQLVHKKSMKIHSKYYCNKHHDEKEWKLSGSLAFCKKCNRNVEPDSIEFHVGYLCQKRQIHVQCFYCPRIFEDYRGLLCHTNHAHHKKHKYQDLLSILPQAESHFSPQGLVKVVRNFFNNYLNTTEEAFMEKNNSSDLRFQVRKKISYNCDSCGKVLVGTHAYENHVNTKCESEDNYSCFFCVFKAEYPYQVLDHMEEEHDKKFNTFDILQAQLTGIIPTVEHIMEEIQGDEEIAFANQELFEPFIPAAPFAEHVIKAELNGDLKKMKNPQNNKNLDNSQDVRVKVEIGKSSKTNPCQEDSDEDYEDMVDGEEISDEVKHQKIEFMKTISLKALKKESGKVGNKLLNQKRRRKNVCKIECNKCRGIVHPMDARIHKRYHCGKNTKPEWILKSGKALCLRCKHIQMSNSIDFHVAYLCKRKIFAVQCFYCPKVAHNYRSLLTHMRSGHNKTHYLHDLMTILPQAEFSLKSMKGTPNSTHMDENVVRHQVTFEPPIKDHKNDPGCAKFPSREDLYQCFYCSYVSKAAYKVLEHMEDSHSKRHNLYDLLEDKMSKLKVSK